MSQDSLPGVGDTEGGGSLVLVPVRWKRDQVARIEALHNATGLPRSLLWRGAFDQGIDTLERSVAAVVGVGVVTGTGEPA